MTCNQCKQEITEAAVIFEYGGPGQTWVTENICADCMNKGIEEMEHE